nr:MAG TPA: hypothetical protein [Caudoviricetes sp.]
MTPVKHNLSAIKSEFITLTIGYNGTVEPEDLFSCVRKFTHDEQYKAKFNIDVSKDNLTADERCRIILSLDTKELNVGRYVWDLFIWAGGRPVKCLVKGQLTILEGVSNRGK